MKFFFVRVHVRVCMRVRVCSPSEGGGLMWGKECNFLAPVLSETMEKPVGLRFLSSYMRIAVLSYGVRVIMGFV